MKVKLSSIMSKGRAMYLAYDQGLEHGPQRDFNDKNVDPLYILDIAKKVGFNGIVFQKGIAEKYQKEIKRSGVPLIVKLNGKTSLYKGEPISRALCTVKEAKKLGAKAVGFTIFIGSEHESKMFSEFEKIQREAHSLGLPVIAWIYPRGKSVKKPESRESIAYAARVGLELGADIVKIHWSTTERDLKWAVKSAGRCKLVIAGGSKKTEKDFLKGVEIAMKAGASGLAVGRNVWQSKDPISLGREIKKRLYKSSKRKSV